jgi:hypothetical protein
MTLAERSAERTSSMTSNRTTGRSSTRPPRSIRATTRLIVRIVIALAAIGGAFASGSSTGLPVADVLWSTGFAALLAAASSRSRRWPTIWLAGAATAAGIGSWWAVAAALALVLAISGVVRDQRGRVVGAVVGALAAQVLLRLPDLGPHGTSAAIVVVAVVPVLWSGYDRSPRDLRRQVRTAVLVTAGIAGLAVLLAAGAAVLARGDLQRGADEAQQGLDLVRDGEQGPGSQRLEQASASFSSAASLLDAPWTWPAQALPVVGDHATSLAVAATSGRDLTSTASVQAQQAPYRELRPSAGQLDLAVVRAMQEPVRAALDELEVADARLDGVQSDWLLPPVAGPMSQLADEVADARHEAQLASSALEVAPALLGGDGDRDYLVLFTSPAEARSLGGFVGAYGVLHAAGGEVEFTTSGGADEITLAPGAEDRSFEGEAAAELETRYGRFDPTRFAQNLTVSPDFETDALLARSVYEQTTGTAVDGVLVVDPYAQAALLQLTGPVTVEGRDEPMTADTAAAFLLHEQYLDDEQREDRKDELEAVADATFDALTNRDLPGPATVASALGAVVEEKRLLFFPFVEDENTFFADIDATGTFEPSADGDVLSVRSTNTIGNKIDWFLHRAVAFDVTVDPGRDQVQGTLTLTLRNDAPAGGLPAYVIGDEGDDPPDLPLGTSEQLVSVYTRLVPTSVTVDGDPAGVEAQAELGGQVWSVPVSIGPGATATIVLELAGEVEDAADFSLDLLSQPLVHTDELTLSIQGAGGWDVVGVDGLELEDGVARYEGELATDQRVGVTFG